MHRIMLRRSLATFTRYKHDGTKVNIEIRPSYAHKPKAVENLMKGLPDLLGPESSSSGNRTESSSAAWELDESGDTIHRHISLTEEKEISAILKQINEAAQDLKHDPHTHIDGTNLTISCTTHSPPGLSMKDVKLAKKIDVIIQDATSTNSESISVISPEQKQHAEERNMEAIRKAKEDCNCG